MQMLHIGLWTYGGVRSFSSSRACTRSCPQMGGGKCSQANNYPGICDDYCNVTRIMVINDSHGKSLTLWRYGWDNILTTSWQHGTKMMTTIFRFNSVTLETERPSILGPGFTAPPGGPEYLNRNTIKQTVFVLLHYTVIWSSARNDPDATMHCTSYCWTWRVSDQDCNELALLLLGFGSSWQWVLWPHTQVHSFSLLEEGWSREWPIFIKCLISFLNHTGPYDPLCWSRHVTDTLLQSFCFKTSHTHLLFLTTGRSATSCLARWCSTRLTLEPRNWEGAPQC